MRHCRCPCAAAELPQAPRTDFVQRKAVTAMRTHISTLLDIPRAYDLERLDLEVETSLDGEAQALVARILAGLRTPDLGEGGGTGRLPHARSRRGPRPL